MPSPIKLKRIVVPGIRLLRNRILVSADKPEQVTPGGIIIPETAQEQQNKGKVVAVGPGTKDDPMLIKIGSMVCYGEECGAELQIDGKDHLIMSDKDVLYTY